jgi:iron complex transport system substrate-binding protein
MRRILKIRFLWLILCLIGLTLNAGRVGAKNTVVVKDMLGRAVTVPAKLKRIVGIEAGALRLLVYLDAAALVVGVEDTEQKGLTKPYLIAHPELAKLPVIGPIHGGDAELIATQKPEVIFWTSTTVGKADALQQKTGVPVIALNYGDLDNQKPVLYDALRLTAKVLHKEARAAKLINSIEALIKDLDGRTKDAPSREKVYVGGVAYRGAHGIASTEPDYAPFRFVNAHNVAATIKLEHAFIEKEKLLEWNPDKIFVDTASFSLVKNDLGPGGELGSILKAVKNKQLYTVMPYNWYTTNFATVLANAYYIGKVLYPQQFRDINPETKADRIYRLFVGKGVYASMKKMYGGFHKLRLE